MFLVCFTLLFEVLERGLVVKVFNRIFKVQPTDCDNSLLVICVYICMLCNMLRFPMLLLTGHGQAQHGVLLLAYPVC